MPVGWGSFEGTNGLSSRLAESLDLVMSGMIHPVMDRYHIGAVVAGLLGVMILIRLIGWFRR